MSLQKHKRLIIPKITKAAAGEECLANFPGCTGTSEDVCFRHLNESFAGKGMAMKSDDFAGFFGCQHCENLYAGLITDRRITDSFDDDRYWYVLRAVIKTMRRLFDKGVIK